MITIDYRIDNHMESERGLNMDNNLELLRNQNYMSQQDVAKLLGMSQTNYRKIEKGLNRLTVDVAQKLVVIFKVNSIEDLVNNHELSKV
jgi:DNA-binding XRE family transcriptional regulator